MARSISSSLLLSLILFGLLLSATLAAAPERGYRPEPDEPIDPIALPNAHSDEPAGAAPQVAPPPFSKPEAEGPDLDELADKIKELAESIGELIGGAAATTTTAAAAAASSAPTVATSAALPSSPAGAVNATLGCEIYEAYTSICPAVTVTPYTGSDGPFTWTVDASDALTEAASSRASCLCYSAAYYVPFVYDNAAGVCASYSPDAANPPAVTEASALTAAASAAAAQTQSFCSSIGNVRPGASPATFGQFAAATATPTPTTSTASAPASSPTSTGGGARSSGAVGGAVLWPLAAAIAALV